MRRAGGALIGDLFGWRAAFFGGAALAVGVLLAQLRLLTSVPPSRPVTPRDLVLPLRLPMARIGLIAIVLLFIGHFAAYTYLRPLLQQVFVLSPSAISLQLLAYGAIGLLGTFLGERLGEYSLRATFILIAAMLAAILIVSPLLSGLGGATLMVMVWGWPSARCRYAPPTGCSPPCRRRRRPAGAAGMRGADRTGLRRTAGRRGGGLAGRQQRHAVRRRTDPLRRVGVRPQLALRRDWR